MKTGGNFSPHRGADIFRFRPILCLLKRWDYLFRDWNCSYTLKQIDNADKFIGAIEEPHLTGSSSSSVHHEHRIQPALKLGHTQAAYRKPRRFKGFGLRKMPKLHPHMHSYLECHVFESHRRYQNGAPQRYAPEKPRRCLGFSFSERVRGANGLP